MTGEEVVEQIKALWARGYRGFRLELLICDHRHTGQWGRLDEHIETIEPEALNGD